PGRSGTTSGPTNGVDGAGEADAICATALRNGAARCTSHSASMVVSGSSVRPAADTIASLPDTWNDSGWRSSPEPVMQDTTDADSSCVASAGSSSSSTQTCQPSSSPGTSICFAL